MPNPLAGLTYNAMETAASEDAEIAKRVNLYRFRVWEEVYDIVNDPNALHNLIDALEHQERLQHYRKRMYEYMKNTQNELLPTYLEQIKR